jgi:hypothetical protein
MPSSPLWSPKLLVCLLAVGVTFSASWVTLRLPETPPAVHRWPAVLLDRLATGITEGGRERFYWTGMAVYAAFVSVLHFGGLQLAVYQAIEQWDTLTHLLSGAGVAALLYLTFHLESPGRRLRWIVPAVLAIGAGFEIYEFLLKDFWHGWSLKYYVTDTLLDLGNNLLGSLLVVTGLRIGAGSGRNTRR